jgi:hypothetical protein
VIRALRRDPVLAAAFAVAWAAALFAIWAPRVVPLGGWYEQLAIVQVWRHLHDWRLERFYARELALVPGWLHTGVIRALASVFPIDVAGRIWLSLYALALPIGAVRLARAFGRSLWLALFVLPLVWNLPLASGHAGFAAGLTVALFALAELELFLRQPARARAITFAVLACAVWLGDAGAFGFLVLAAVILCATERPVALVLILPSVALALIGARSLPAGGAPPEPAAMLQRLEEVPWSLAMTFGERAHEVLLLLLGVWLILLLSARTDEHDTQARGYRLEALALLALILALTLPPDMHRPIELPLAAGRFWPVCALLLALLPHGPVEGRRRLWLLPVVVLGILYSISIGRAALPLEKTLGGARRLSTRLEHGKSALTVNPEHDRTSRTDDPLPFGPRVRFRSQAHVFPVLAAGGYDPDLPIAFPLRRTEVIPTPAVRSALDPDTLGYDYLLTLDERYPYEILGPNAAAPFPLTATDGNWRLYQRRTR